MLKTENNLLITDGKTFAFCGFCGLNSSTVIGYITVNNPDIF